MLCTEHRARNNCPPLPTPLDVISKYPYPPPKTKQTTTQKGVTESWISGYRVSLFLFVVMVVEDLGGSMFERNHSRFVYKANYSHPQTGSSATCIQSGWI